MPDFRIPLKTKTTYNEQVLQEASIKIKKAMHQLKLVTQQNVQHFDLKPTIPTKFELAAECPITCKIASFD